LSATDYTVKYSATDGYTVTRNDTGASVTSTYDSSNATLTFAGMSVAISGTANSGDSFLVLPTRNAASSFSTVTSDGSLIAAGTSTGASDNSNALAMLNLQTSNIVSGSKTSARPIRPWSATWQHRQQGRRATGNPVRPHRPTDRVAAVGIGGQPG
jgi:flagellar hook-associated protein 1 FlgK